MTREEFEELLNETAEQLGKEVRESTAYHSPSNFERRVMAADDELWGKLDDALLDAILDSNQKQVSRISKQNEWLSTAQQWTRLKLTAPLETVTLAAAKALGIQEASE